LHALSLVHEGPGSFPASRVAAQRQFFKGALLCSRCAGSPARVVALIAVDSVFWIKMRLPICICLESEGAFDEVNICCLRQVAVFFAWAALNTR
jgi:hypothetical protein